MDTYATSGIGKITIEDIESIMRKMPKPLPPEPNWQIVDSPWVPKTSQVWVPPPNTPFVEYEESDHGWLKKLGFGSYEEREVRWAINTNAFRIDLDELFKFDAPAYEPKEEIVFKMFADDFLYRPRFY